MIVNHICSRIKSIFLGILAIFNRALCCFSRKRRNSFSDCEVLQSVNVQTGNTNNNRGGSIINKRNDTDRDWNSWDDSPRTVDEHIEQYRQKLAVQNVPAEKPEPNVDFFEDMTPKIIKQTKVLVPTSENSAPTNFSRLQAASTIIPYAAGAELEDWSDDEEYKQSNTTGGAGGWEELNDEQTKHLIREKRREQRMERHSKLIAEKMAKHS